MLHVKLSLSSTDSIPTRISWVWMAMAGWLPAFALYRFNAVCAWHSVVYRFFTGWYCFNGYFVTCIKSLTLSLLVLLFLLFAAVVVIAVSIAIAPAADADAVVVVIVFDFIRHSNVGASDSFELRRIFFAVSIHFLSFVFILEPNQTTMPLYLWNFLRIEGKRCRKDLCMFPMAQIQRSFSTFPIHVFLSISLHWDMYWHSLTISFHTILRDTTSIQHYSRERKTICWYSHQSVLHVTTLFEWVFKYVWMSLLFTRCLSIYSARNQSSFIAIIRSILLNYTTQI